MRAEERDEDITGWVWCFMEFGGVRVCADGSSASGPTTAACSDGGRCVRSLQAFQATLSSGCSYFKDDTFRLDFLLKEVLTELNQNLGGHADI